MKSIKGRGRPIESDEIIVKYTQNFRDHTDVKYKWEWDKEKFPNGPLSVTIDDPQFNTSEKLLRELEQIELKYIPKKGDRKPRIVKIDKQRIEEINRLLEEFHYGLYPEDAPIIKIRKNAKTKNKKV